MIRPEIQDGVERKDRMAVVFRQRAEALSAKETKELHQSGGDAVLVFSVGEERYAVKLKELSGVFPFQNCTPVPMAVRQICGVMNIRGEICCIMDLAVLLGKADSRDEGNQGYVLLLKPGGLGVKIDQVLQTRLVRETDRVKEKKARHVLSTMFSEAVLQGNIVLLNSHDINRYSISLLKGDPEP